MSTRDHMSEEAMNHRMLRDQSPIELPIREKLSAAMSAATLMMELGLKLDNGDVWAAGYYMTVETSQKMAELVK